MRICVKARVLFLFFLHLQVVRLRVHCVQECNALKNKKIKKCGKPLTVYYVISQAFANTSVNQNKQINSLRKRRGKKKQKNSSG